MVEVAGFEPTTFWSRTKRATKLRYTSKEANEGTRTLDLRFTKPLLYRLSHIGIKSAKRILARKGGIVNPFFVPGRIPEGIFVK